MTLREFTENYAPLPLSQEDYWRKVFPTNLRWHTIVDVPPKIKYGWFLSRTFINAEIHKELEEQWERVHKGEIINTEWRKVYTY